MHLYFLIKSSDLMIVLSISRCLSIYIEFCVNSFLLCFSSTKYFNIHNTKRYHAFFWLLWSFLASYVYIFVWGMRLACYVLICIHTLYIYIYLWISYPVLTFRANSVCSYDGLYNIFCLSAPYLENPILCIFTGI